MKTLNAVLLVPVLNLIEWFDRLFRPVRPQKPASSEEEIFPIFENEPRAVVREVEERTEPPPDDGLVMEERTLFRPIPHKGGIAFEVSEDFEPVFTHKSESEIKAPLGFCLRKSVLFRTKSGKYLSAKVVGGEGEFLVLSRKNGPLFRRRLSVA